MPKIKPLKALRKGKRRHHPERQIRRWVRSQLIRRSRGACEYCGCAVEFTHGKDNSATLDHVIPLALGGQSAPANMRVACRACNQDKGAKTLEEWVGGEANEQEGSST